MPCTLKAFTVALIATLALAAVGSSSALATPAFTSESSTTSVEGDASKVTISVTGLETTCAKANLKAEFPGTSTSSLAFSPEFTECIGELGVFKVEAKITGFGHFGEKETCDYVLNAVGTVDLECEGSAEVKVVAGTCTFHIPEQTGIGTASFANGTSGGKGDITATLTLSGITMTHTDGIGCPFSGSGSGKNGSMFGSVTLKSASGTSFTSESSTTSVEGDASKVTISVTGLETTCAKANLKAEFTGTSTSSLAFSPEFTECIGELGAFKVEVKITGFGHFGEKESCDYVLNAVGTVDLECEGSADVTVVAGTCTIHIPEQTGIGTVSYSSGSSGGKGDITATLTLSGISENHTDGIGCPFSGSGSGKNGSMFGSVTLIAKNTNTGEATGISTDLGGISHDA